MGAAPPTRRLYFEDPWLLDFEAAVVAHAPAGERWALVLDATAFYPEGGGQLADLGRIADCRVLDVQLAGDEVRHVVEGPLPPVGSRVACGVDRERRRVHMALHTGQHILSRALAEVAAAETVSARLGDGDCTIDVDVDGLSDAVLGKALDLASAVVDDDVPIVAQFPSEEELATMKLRRAPKRAQGVRVIQIGDFDLTPCGGTHCTRSAQVGLITITSSERYKGGTRVHFAAGRRARERLSDEANALRALSRQLTCAPGEVARKFEKLSAELAKTREDAGRVRAELARRIAAELATDAGPVIARLSIELDVARAVLARLCERPGAIAALAVVTGEGLHVLAARGEGAEFDAGAFIKRLAVRGGGRGGGRPERAEGRLPGDAEFEHWAWAALAS